MLSRITRAQRIANREKLRAKKLASSILDRQASQKSNFQIPVQATSDFQPFNSKVVSFQTPTQILTRYIANWNGISDVKLVELPWITIPTVESLLLPNAQGLIVPREAYSNIQRSDASAIKPGAEKYYSIAKVWSDRNYKPISGSEAMLTQQINKLSGLTPEGSIVAFLGLLAIVYFFGRK